MYNSNIKMDYINIKSERTNLPSGYLETLFTKSETIESSINTDLCNFNVNEIIGFYKLLNMRSYDTLVVVNSHCKLYTDYCIMKGLVLDNQNHYLEITPEQLLSCLNSVSFLNRIITHEDLVNDLNSLDNYCDKFIMQCLYEGIDGYAFSDIFLLKKSDINYSKGTAKLFSGRTVNVSKTLIDYAYHSDEELIYYRNVIEESKNVKTNKLIDTGYIIKRTKKQLDYSGIKDVKDPKFTKMTRSRVNRIFKLLGYTNIITPNSVLESGIIHLINKYAKENNVSGKAALYSKDCLDLIYNQYGKKIVRSSFYYKYKNFLAD